MCGVWDMRRGAEGGVGREGVLRGVWGVCGVWDVECGTCGGVLRGVWSVGHEGC